MAPLGALLLLLTTSTPAPHCFVPADQTAGWKRVALPDEAPAIAAPGDLDQFRSGEVARVYEQNVSTYLGTTDEHPGRMSYFFHVPPDAQQLELVFLEELGGAKVDAVTYTGSAALPLLSERRVGGNRLLLDWRMEGVSNVQVTIHHHLRARPVVYTWRVTRVLKPGEQKTAADFFRAPRSLYYLHPGGGRRIELCEAPYQQLHLTHALEEHGAAEVVVPHP